MSGAWPPVLSVPQSAGGRPLRASRRFRSAGRGFGGRGWGCGRSGSCSHLDQGQREGLDDLLPLPVKLHVDKARNLGGDDLPGHHFAHVAHLDGVPLGIRLLLLLSKPRDQHQPQKPDQHRDTDTDANSHGIFPKELEKDQNDPIEASDFMALSSRFNRGRVRQRGRDACIGFPCFTVIAWAQRDVYTLLIRHGRNSWTRLSSNTATAWRW